MSRHQTSPGVWADDPAITTPYVPRIGVGGVTIAAMVRVVRLPDPTHPYHPGIPSRQPAYRAEYNARRREQWRLNSAAYRERHEL